MIDLPEQQRVQLEDADTLVSDLICEGLNNEIRAAGATVADDLYSAETRDLIRRAWTIAAALQHRVIVADHIIIALVTGDEAFGSLPPDKFANYGIDQNTLRGSALARLAGLPQALSELPLLVPDQRPSPDVTRWISEGMQIAQARGDEVAPEDLLLIVQNARQLDHPHHAQLQDVMKLFYPEARLSAPTVSPIVLPRVEDLVPVETDRSPQPSAEVGAREVLYRISSGFSEANRAIGNVQHTASRARTEVRRLRNRELTQLHTQVNDLGNQLTEVDRRTAEMRGAQLVGLAAVVGDCRDQMGALDRQMTEIRDNQLARLSVAVGDCRNQLSDLDRRTAELDRETAAITANLPRPLATGWLALLIVTVLVIGGAAGIVLRHPSLPAAVEKLLKS